MPTSTIPAFKQALYTALTNATALQQEQTEVVWGWPTDMPQTEVVAITKTELRERAPVIATGMYREEQYMQHVWIRVVDPGSSDQQYSETRLYTLYGAVESVIRPELGGDITMGQTVSTVQIQSAEIMQYGDSNGREAGMDVVLKVLARI